MKKTIILMGALFIGACAYAAKPNIVIIYTDDMGYGDVSYCNKEAKIQTPAIDSLVASGMTFTDGHSSSGICTPSRFALLTGQHHWRRFHDIVHGFGESVFKPDDFTIAKMLKSKGYNTACVGKWHLGWNWQAMELPTYQDNKSQRAKGKVVTRGAKYFPEDLDWSKKIPMGPTAQGFDYYFGDGTVNFPPYTWIENDKVLFVPTKMVELSLLDTARKEGAGTLVAGPMSEEWGITKVLPSITKKAVEWINTQSADKPFFLYFALNSPHAPIAPNDEYDGKSQAGPYGDFVVESDDMISKVLGALKDKGFYDNTLIIFTADNGSAQFLYDRQKKYGHWSSGPVRGSKRHVIEGGHRVPFIMSWKGHIKAGSVCDDVVSQVDFAATFAEIVGYDLSKEEAQDSYSILPILEGKDYKKPLRYATVQNTEKDGAYALRQGDWIYINQYVGAGKQYIPNGKTLNYGKKTDGLLFNLKEDIEQVNNLYEQHPEMVKEMKALLDEYISGKPTAPHAQ
ncbi:MAG: arylsulfatase [Opitutales bacterium]